MSQVSLFSTGGGLATLVRRQEGMWGATELLYQLDPPLISPTEADRVLITISRGTVYAQAWHGAGHSNPYILRPMQADGPQPALAELGYEVQS